MQLGSLRVISQLAFRVSFRSLGHRGHCGSSAFRVVWVIAGHGYDPSWPVMTRDDPCPVKTITFHIIWKRLHEHGSWRVIWNRLHLISYENDYIIYHKKVTMWSLAINRIIQPWPTWYHRPHHTDRQHIVNLLKLPFSLLHLYFKVGIFYPDLFPFSSI